MHMLFTIVYHVIKKREYIKIQGDGEMKFRCPVCGYIHIGNAPPANCPQCGAPGSKFVKVENETLTWAAEHVIGVAKDVNPKILEGLRRHLEEGRMRFPLFDSLATTRALEAAYAHAAWLHRSGHAPQAFTLPLPS